MQNQNYFLFVVIYLAKATLFFPFLRIEITKKCFNDFFPLDFFCVGVNLFLLAEQWQKHFP